MIAKMRKLNLAALSYDRDAVLNALQRTNAVELKEDSQTECEPLTADRGELAARLAAVEEALEVVTAAAEAREKKNFQKDGFSVRYSEFDAALGLRGRAEEVVAQVRALSEEIAAGETEQAKLLRTIAAAEPYRMLDRPVSAFHDTRATFTRLGTLTSSAWEEVRPALDSPLVAYSAQEGGELVLLAVTGHLSVRGEVDSLLGGAAFSACPFSGNKTGAELLGGLEADRDAAQKRTEAAQDALAALSDEIRMLKLYADRVSFELEKADAAAMMHGTERTFFLEAFVPADEEEKVARVLGALPYALWYSFSDPSEDEAVPTLLRNNPVVANFESITNMYSPPNARELDPNTVMGFFYSLFLGFIMADIGYGLLMILGGGALYFRMKGGVKSLAGVFAVGGFFTVFWGSLFNSLFGIAVLPFTVMPDARSSMYHFIGIGIPSVLIVSLLLGAFQLFAGYLCKMAQHVRRGEIADGILDGGVWAVFSLGVELALIGLVEEFHLSVLSTVGGIIAAVCLAVAVCTAGRKEKALGKISKGFGAAYGLVNYFTDVLSYIRLYGLMLTGAVIAQVVSQYSIQFMTSGSALVVLGPILMVAGHLFNLAISLLGAYIHTARLQYVEFFGRFYEGEGELFVPLGSSWRHIEPVADEGKAASQEA